MAGVDLEAAARYIESVPLFEVVREGETAADSGSGDLAEGRPQVTVVASNIVTFPESTPLAVRNAVANWTLMAQCAASKAVNEKDAVRAWMDKYIDALTTSGWVVRESESTETKEDVYGSTMYDKVLALVAVALGPVPTALAIVTAGLQALQSMNRDSPWITLFDRRGKSAKAVGFQVANCETDGSGAAALRGVEFIVEAHQQLTQVLFFRFSSHEATVYRRARTLTLSAAAIAKLSAKVEDRVLDMMTDNIRTLDL